MSHTLPVLSLLETRVLGVLAEKQRTVPDSYPLTLNSLVSGCNQKSSRDPVIEATEAEVQATLDRLRSLSLIVETSGGRAAHYGHNIERVLHIPAQSTALLTMLMLRGPQTAGELRINCERLHKFADISSVESFLAEFAERTEGGLVMELPRQPGARENRWMHLLSGAPAIEERTSASATLATPDITVGEIAALKANVAKLEAEVSELRTLLGKLYQELGVSAT
ncbi:MAG TPA: YceH family protein [Gallionellaceae bacterium]|nr:YceH family protein [Gallionellaceae bacterium]